MIEVKITDGRWFGRMYRRVLPNSFSELSQARLLSLLRILIATTGNVQRAAVLEYCLDVPKRVIAKMDEENVGALLQHLEWCTLEETPVPVVKSFRHRGVEYFLPGDKFNNGLAIEYPLADEFFSAYIEHGHYRDLVRLAATLCREGKSDQAAIVTTGDHRVPLVSRSQVEHRATKEFEDLPPELLAAVMYYFAGVKKMVYEVYGSFLFDQPEEQTDIDGNPLPVEKKDGALFGWWGVYMDLAENLSNLDKIYQMNFHTVCMMLVKKRKEQMDMERQLKLHKTT